MRWISRWSVTTSPDSQTGMRSIFRSAKSLMGSYGDLEQFVKTIYFCSGKDGRMGPLTVWRFDSELMDNLYCLQFHYAVNRHRMIEPVPFEVIFSGAEIKSGGKSIEADDLTDVAGRGFAGSIALAALQMKSLANSGVYEDLSFVIRSNDEESGTKSARHLFTWVKDRLDEE